MRAQVRVYQGPLKASASPFWRRPFHAVFSVAEAPAADQTLPRPLSARAAKSAPAKAEVWWRLLLSKGSPVRDPYSCTGI